ncbi:MAG: hypothetical protein C0595_02990 [Marinilabiliales bacterium]|nr:MAG: hypothetical protein C0595_02990 [Marinilabiliales bacterium]
MKKTVYVNTGALAFGSENVILNSGAIGSCVVVTIFDKEKRIGAMAHIMLPGESPKKHKPSNKYAANAIRNLHNYFVETTSKSENLICCIVGGANVLRKKDDRLCRDIIKSVEEEILKNNLIISKRNVGDELRRTMQFDTSTGDVFYSIGNSGLSLLWSIDN